MTADTDVVQVIDSTGHPWEAYPIVTIPCVTGCGDRFAAGSTTAARALLGAHYATVHPEILAGVAR